MRKILYALLAVSIMLINGCSSGRQSGARPITPDIKLKSGTYTAKWEIPDKDTGYTAFAPCYAEYLKQFPKDVKTPKFRSKAPLLGIIRVGFENKAETEFYFAIDESKVTGVNHDLLYLDANRNLDLTDDGRTAGKIDRYLPDYPGNGIFKSAVRIPLNQLLPSSNNSNPVELDLQISLDPKYQPYLRNNIRGCYAGEADSNKGKVHFQIWDMNLNGRYDDKWSEKPGHKGFTDADVIVFGRNKAPKEYGDEPTYSVCLVSSADSLNRKLYILTPGKSGESLQVTDYTGSTGKVSLMLGKIGGTKIAVGHRALRIYGDSGIFGIPSHGEPVNLPVGEYYAYVMDIGVDRNKGKYVFWPLRYFHSAPITVKENQTSIISVEGNIKFVIAPEVKDLVLKRGTNNGTPIRYLLPKGNWFTLEAKGCRRSRLSS